MFKQAGTEPWMANCLRWRTHKLSLLEHLVRLSSNTLYMVEYIEHMPVYFYDTTSFP